MTPVWPLQHPVCDSQIHEFGPFAPAPQAEYWANWHGCAVKFACRDCLTAIEEAFGKRAPITCTQCGRAFDLLADYLTWRPL
ncbi:hypothetical protein [Nocardia farcinica]|uniref:hypothetical protein n=1 Tax=Nocardia farcinica TaxID=37329 RepID=UPI0024550E1F|nr:hypothetical protein [Nocardia farcinica]